MRPTDVVLEVGPGTGNMTVKLLEKAKKVKVKKKKKVCFLLTHLKLQTCTRKKRVKVLGWRSHKLIVY